ncbi:MAG: Rossmann-like and DUF2520 domain-containing protein [Ginsengibacter sp.]
MKVVIVGSGNAATVLSVLIQKGGHEIVQVASRNIDNARMLASKYNATAVALNEPAFAPADIYIVSLADVALDSIEKIGALRNKFVVHTAGSVSMDVLKNITTTYGVLYPLQTLSRVTQEIPEVPFLVEGNNQETADKIVEFARSISGSVITANEQERLQYHVAAVFVSNFTNHLYAIAEGYCEKENLDFRNMLPLINEVTSRINHNSPYKVQTGPAIREDIITLNLHLQALAAHPHVKYLYLKLSESILKIHEKKR